MNQFLKTRFGTRKVVIGTIAAVVLLGAGSLAFRGSAKPTVPTAEVKRGEFVDTIQIRGDVQALHSVQLNAPSIAGDLQIVKLVPTGTMVKKGDVVVQFDPAALQRTLAQQRSVLKSSEADIEHSRAEAKLSHEQQSTDLLQAGYDVDRAKLDSSKQEILSEIDGAETKLKLSDSQQKLKELQQKDVSTQQSASAEIESKKQKREKSAFDVKLTERQIELLTLRAPTDGMVTIMPNFRARNWTNGNSTPDFKEGDRAWPGAVVAELPDLSNVRMSARVDESDRGRLRSAQSAAVRIDAISDKEFQAQVSDISPLAKVDYTSWPFTKNFDIAIQILEKDARIRPGMSASGRIAVEKIPDGILVPAEAVFEKNGRSVAYVLNGSRFEERAVQITRRGKSQLLIASGVRPGEKVALKDPTQEKQTP
jgi:RND family efflux transporter MFP subunit